LELGLDLSFQSAATADSITGPEGGQQSFTNIFNKSRIFMFLISTVAYCYKPNY